MKKTILQISKTLVLLTIFTMISCAEDDPNPIENQTSFVLENLKSGVLDGNLDQDFTLNSSTVYELTNSFIIESGNTLTIPAGTQIIADNGGTDVYIAVLKGAKININGTDTEPVIMSSINGNPGDWGGLTLCGNATTTAGADAQAEVGGFIYGGTDDADNSGIIRNLIISGTGAQINSESQYNGISFYAVGSGTIVENIAIINGADDGIEFFGGTVSVQNVYLKDNEDDSIDWTEGWNGTITNSYITHTVPGFSTVVEGDKDNRNPKLINLTAISTVGGTALQFKKESGATITDLHLVGYDKNIDMKDGGSLTNVIIDGIPATFTNNYNTGSPVEISTWNWISNEYN